MMLTNDEIEDIEKSGEYFRRNYAPWHGDRLVAIAAKLRQAIGDTPDDLAALNAEDLYKWVKANLPNTIDPVEPGEWFLHAYGTNYLVDGQIPDWGLLQYRGDLLQTIRSQTAEPSAESEKA